MSKLLSPLPLSLSPLPLRASPASGTAIASTQTVKVEGKAVEFQIYVLADANGNPTNHIKLRDPGKALAFHVSWNNGVIVEGDKPYAG